MAYASRRRTDARERATGQDRARGCDRGAAGWLPGAEGGGSRRVRSIWRPRSTPSRRCARCRGCRTPAYGYGRSASPATPTVRRMGRVAQLQLPAMGAIGIRGPQPGSCCSCSRSRCATPRCRRCGLAVVAGAGMAGRFLADAIAPALRTHRREEAVVIASLCSAAIGALLASSSSGSPCSRSTPCGGGGRGVRPAGVPGLDATVRAPRGALGGCSSATRCSSRSRG